jgi:hypothetical protein
MGGQLLDLNVLQTVSKNDISNVNLIFPNDSVDLLRGHNQQENKMGTSDENFYSGIADIHMTPPKYGTIAATSFTTLGIAGLTLAAYVASLAVPEVYIIDGAIYTLRQLMLLA